MLIWSPMMWSSLVFFGLISVVLGKTEYKEENNVASLTKDNFDAVIDEHEAVLVEFFAPWCGHCKALKPEYEKAALKAKTEFPNVLLAMVDATVETELATAHGVSGYPTLKFRKNGKWIDYTGDRKADAIVAWIKRKLEPALRKLESISEAETFVSSSDVTVVGFIKDGNDEAMKALEEVADTLDSFSFAVANTAELFDKYSVSKDVQIVLFKKFDEGRANFEEDIVPAKVKEFVQRESIPLVVEFSQDSAGAVFGSPVRMHVVAFAPKSGDYEKLKGDMVPVAKMFKGQVHFIIIDTDFEDHQRILDFFGMTKDDVPSYRLINLTDDMTKYKPDSSDFSETQMASFIKDVLSGSRKPFLMSQEIPAESNEPVRVLVGKNYNDVTKDTSKAVFVKLYAPWCGHCQQLAPIWTSLGEAFKDRDDIIIAKLDATANEAEGLRVNSFPTLKYYPKGSNEPIDYTGERTLEALKKFVESDGKVSETEETKEKETKDEL